MKRYLRYLNSDLHQFLTISAMMSAYLIPLAINIGVEFEFLIEDYSKIFCLFIGLNYDFIDFNCSLYLCRCCSYECIRIYLDCSNYAPCH